MENCLSLKCLLNETKITIEVNFTSQFADLFLKKFFLPFFAGSGTSLAPNSDCKVVFRLRDIIVTD